MIYSNIVAHDSVRVMLLIIRLDVLSIESVDLKIAFLTAPNMEKCWIITGPEFVALDGKTKIVKKALYCPMLKVGRRKTWVKLTLT